MMIPAAVFAAVQFIPNPIQPIAGILVSAAFALDIFFHFGGISDEKDKDETKIDENEEKKSWFKKLFSHK